jgi:hypothetical protein
MLPNLSYERGTTVVLTPDIDITRKENDRLISLLTTDTNTGKPLQQYIENNTL